MSLIAEKTVTIPVGAAVSDKVTVGDYQRGSFMATAIFTAAVNFDVSNNGTNWETLTAAAGNFADVPAAAVGLPRALPAALFSFKYARLKLAGNQATAPGVAQLNLYAN